jgi:ribosome-associated protein
MFIVNERIVIPESEFAWSFVRAGGPGGQNVNKVASKAVLRWNAAGTPSLPDEVKARFLARNRSRITTEGDILVTGQRFRDQEKNRQECLDKLRAMILEALVVPKKRRATKPTKASKKRRVQAKRHRAATKSARRIPNE